MKVSVEGCDPAAMLQALLNAALTNMGVTLSFAQELLDNGMELDLVDGCLESTDFDKVHGEMALQMMVNEVRSGNHGLGC